MTNQCVHGSLMRVCPICKLQAEVEELRAEVEALRKALESFTKSAYIKKQHPKRYAAAVAALAARPGGEHD